MREQTVLLVLISPSTSAWRGRIQNMSPETLEQLRSAAHYSCNRLRCSVSTTLEEFVSLRTVRKSHPMEIIRLNISLSLVGLWLCSLNSLFVGLVCVCCHTFAYLSDPHLCCLLICTCVCVCVEGPVVIKYAGLQGKLYPCSKCEM